MVQPKFFRIVFLSVIGLGLPFYVGWKNIFPTIKNDLHGLTEWGAGFNEKNVGGERFLVATLQEQYPFNQVGLELNSTSPDDRPEPVTVRLANDRLTNLFPLGQTVENQEELKKLLYDGNPSGISNGSLWSHDEAAVVVSRGKYHQIKSPEIFLSLGYRWEYLQPLDNEVFSQLEEGEMLTFDSFHPDGTLLRTKSGQFLVVWEGQRRPVASQLAIDDAWKTFYWVDVREAELNYLAECQTSFAGNGDLYCSFSLPAEMDSSYGISYIFQIVPDDQRVWPNGEVAFRTKVQFDQTYWRTILGRIKFKLATRYAGYLF